ncbi:MAG: type II secretion system protein GspF [Desulfobulbaceae bacterium]|nr:type II secretion system protein GspF [Desulfobulbaceae bacterium]
MPVFEYTALNAAGKPVQGIVDAPSTSMARDLLRTQKLFPVSIKGTAAHQESRPLFALRDFMSRVSSDELNITTRQLATLLGAGLPLVSSLDALLKQANNPVLKKSLAQIKDAVNEGSSLVQALSHHPRLFSKIYLSMVRAGEASGALDVVLDRLAAFGEHQELLKSRFKSAMVYPIFMAFVGSLVLFSLITFVVPNITKMFADMQQALPWPTVILITASDFLRSYWPILSLVLIGSVFALAHYAATERGGWAWDTVSLRLPMIGAMQRLLAMARFSRTLGSLLRSGVPLLTALTIVRNIVNNRLIAEVIDTAASEVEQGKALSLALGASTLFPPMVIQMMSVGEHSGALEDMLDKVADSFERDINAKLATMTDMIEPVMILAMGTVVGFIVIAILLPIFEMNQMIR